VSDLLVEYAYFLLDGLFSFWRCDFLVMLELSQPFKLALLSGPDFLQRHHITPPMRRIIRVGGLPLCLAPGEAMPWHRDPFQRVAVISAGDLLCVEYRDGGESQRVQITPGQIEWEEPTLRVHRAVNVGKQAYEQVTVFLLDRSDALAQPNEE
jgi:hypothetical protein